METYSNEKVGVGSSDNSTLVMDNSGLDNVDGTKNDCQLVQTFDSSSKTVVESNNGKKQDGETDECMGVSSSGVAENNKSTFSMIDVLIHQARQDEEIIQAIKKAVASNDDKTVLELARRF